MKQFAFPIAIQGTKEQLANISTKLIALGYEWYNHIGNYCTERYPFLKTEYSGVHNYIGYNHNENDKTVVDASNEELVLALAAACNNSIFQKDEYFININNSWDKAAGNGVKPCIYYRRPTKNEILEHFSKKEEVFVLPEKWYIKIDKENIDTLAKWRFNECVPEKFTVGCIIGIPMNSYNKEWNPRITKDWINEITFEQFRQYVLKENISNRRIIGYKAPFNLFSGKIPQGTIYKAKNIGITTVYKCDRCEDVLPKEIVEQWTPIYEAEEVKLVLGTGKIEISIKGGKVFADNKKTWPLYSLKEIIGKMTQGTLNTYQITFPTVKIGCSTFTREELQQIVDIAEKQLQK